MRYDHFSMLPERAFQPRNGRHGMTLEGGGGGGPTTTTTYTSNLPEWLRPQTEALLGAATQEYFTTKPVTTTDPNTGETKTTYDITGIKPYTPYSTRPQDYFAGFSPLQRQAQYETAGMQRPGQFGAATQFAGSAGLGGMGSAEQALGYGQLGAGYGMGAVGMAPAAQAYGQTGADIGMMGLGAGVLGTDVGQEARMFGRQAAGMGGLYEQMATSPESRAAYMSPYVQNVIEMQKQGAIRDAQKAQLAQNLGAVRSGTYGGARQLLATTERERALGSQLANIEAQGLQKAYEQAQQAQQFGVTAGLQGLQGAQAGLGTALQGGQLGLAGVGQALAGQQAGLAGIGQAGQLYGLGMQGAGLGLQGVGGAQAGYGLTGQQAANLANIAQQQQTADLARIQAQAEMGASQQAMEQAYINQAVQNYALAQQYPYQQLAGYSGLLRGYATPSTTVSQYSAAPSFASQAAGLGLTGAAMYNLAKKEGGKIEEDSGIDDLMIRKTLEKVSK